MMASYREDEDPFEEDIVFDQAGLLNANSSKVNTAIRRVSSGKCVLFAKTLGLCGAFFGLGLCLAIPGPVFLTESSVSSIYISRSSGYLLGAIVGGAVFDRFNRLFLLFLGLLITSVFITVVPLCQTWLLETCMVVLGIAMGFLDTGGNVLCLDLWGRNSGPFMQALHFSFGLGTFVVSLLAVPFLEVNSTTDNYITEPVMHIPDYIPVIHNINSRSLPLENANTNEVFDHGSQSLLENFEKGTEHLNKHSKFKTVFDYPKLSTFNQLKIHGSKNLIIKTRPLEVYTIFPFGKTESYNKEKGHLFLQNLRLSSSLQSVLNSKGSTKYMGLNVRKRSHKPLKTDGSKLGNTNWESIHVGTLPSREILSTENTVLPKSNLANNFQVIHHYLKRSVNDNYTLDISEKFGGKTDVSQDNNITNKHTTTRLASTTPVPILHHTKPSKIDGRKLGSNNMESVHVGTLSKDELEEPLTKASVAVNTTSTLALDSTSGVDYSSSTIQSILQGIISPLNQSSVVLPDSDISLSSVTSPITTIDHNIYTTKHFLSTASTFSNNSGNTDFSEITSVYNKVTNKSENGSRAKPEILVKNENLTSSTTEYNSKNLELPENHSSFRNEYATYNVTQSKYREPAIPKSISVTLPSVVTFNEEQAEDSVALQPTVPPEVKHIHHKPVTYDNDTEEINTIYDMIEKYGFNKIQFTYLIVGLFVFFISIVFLGFLCHNPRDPKSKQEEGQSAKKVTNKCVHKSLIGLMATFFFVYVGVEVIFSQLVVLLSHKTGSGVTVAFWGSFTAMRFAAIFMASALSAFRLVLLSLSLSTVGALLIWGVAGQRAGILWAGTGLLGAGLAPIFPSGLLWLERQVRVSHKVASVLVVGEALGRLTWPLGIHSYTVLPLTVLLLHTLGLIVFTILWTLASRQGDKYGYQLASQQDDEEDMMDLNNRSVNHIPSEHRALLNGSLHHP